MGAFIGGYYRKLRAVNSSLEIPPHRGVIGNGSEHPQLTRQDLIDRGLIVNDDRTAVGLHTRRVTGRLQWMHTTDNADRSPLFVDEPVRGCGYCMAEALHSYDLHEQRISINASLFREVRAA
jgi:hypothetical protein